MTIEQLLLYDLPKNPGVYYFKKDKQILYIGKATNLRERTKSYFKSDLGETRGQFIVDMVALANNIEVEETETALEALLLESRLIKKFTPKYNTLSKDNKSYYYVVVTDEVLPRVFVERERVIQFADELPYKIKKTYGPFLQGSLIVEALKILRRLFPFRDKKAGLKHHVQFYESLGLSPKGEESEMVKRYKKTIHFLDQFFQGKKTAIAEELETEMNEAARNFEFEHAQFLKRQLYAIKHIHDISLINNDFINDIVRSDIRVEAYDIAHMSGKDMVGVMVVLEDGMPNKSEYKKFKIRTRTNADDTGSLDEVLRRRFKHTEWQFPQLIVIDGGKAQISRARAVMLDLGIKIPVVSVVKDDKHKAREILGTAATIKKFQTEILLANSESHRFALRYHVEMRGRGMKKSDCIR